MKAFVSVMDREWFAFLQGQLGLTAVNCWQPSGSTGFRALQPLLLKLEYPENAIVGGGCFSAYSASW